jgi:hypothetical protein
MVVVLSGTRTMQHRSDRRLVSVVTAGLLALAALPSQATELNTLQLLNQAEFNLLVKDLGAATSYKGLASATPLGLTGFDIAVHSAFTDPVNKAVLSKAAGGADIPSTVPVPGVRVAKGLPFGFDIGGTYMAVPKFKGNLAGVELRWAALEGGVFTPAIGLRLAATKLSGVDQLSLSTQSAEVSISKGFAIVTPYAGAGVVRTSGKAQGVSSLLAENPSQSKLFAGVHLNLVVFDITAEADRTGDTNSVNVRLGFRF